jgi:hypothetical protein
MVAFMPLSDKRTTELADEMESCEELAWQLGSWLGAKGCPVLMYGARSGRSLRDTRRGTSFFSSVNAQSPREVSSKLQFDFGPSNIPQHLGISVIGSQAYVTNFNIQISRALASQVPVRNSSHSNSSKGCKNSRFFKNCARAQARHEKRTGTTRGDETSGCSEVAVKMQAVQVNKQPATPVAPHNFLEDSGTASAPIRDKHRGKQHTRHVTSPC